MYRLSICILLLLLSLHPAGGQPQPDEPVRGRASYYARHLHGQRMSNGSRYHRDSLTCAHRTYPFGTLLEVTNLHNNKSVIVEVTDRGPYVRNRIIDLSHAAAHALGMLRQGVIQVMVREHNPMPFCTIVIPFDRNGFLLPVTEPAGMRATIPEGK